MNDYKTKVENSQPELPRKKYEEYGLTKEGFDLIISVLRKLWEWDRETEAKKKEGQS